MKSYLTLAFSLFFSLAVSAQTSFMTGDIAVVGVNANNSASCGDTSGTDIISFVCFKDITNGTTLDLTDNGYERTFPSLWGDTEGTYRATRTGGTITAGTVITFKIRSGAFSSMYPDTSWTFNSINGGWNSFNINSGGDQIYFMQGGVWSGHTDTVAHNATYLGGNILFGFNTKTTWNSFQNSTQLSGLYPNMSCFSMTPTSGTDFVKYTGPMTPATQKDWIIRISNQANWTRYTTCALYNSGLPDYSAGATISITEFFNVDAGINDTACQNQAAFTLAGTPPGGYWTGTGISDTAAGLFDPWSSGAGTFDVTYIFNDAGCPYHDVKSIIIRPKPLVNMNPSPGETCPGSDLNISSIVTSGSAPYSQHWTGDTLSLNNTGSLNPVFNALSTGNYNFILTVTDSKGCVGTSALAVHVNPNPVATVTPDSVIVCAGINATLTATPGGGSLSYPTHQWTGNTSILSGSITQPVVTVNSSSAGSYNLTYTVTDSKGCKGNVSVSVTILPNPVISFLPVSETTCSGDTTSILISSSIPGTAFDWTVSENGVTGGHDDNGAVIAQPLVFVSLPGTATYEVIGTAATCIGIGSATVTVNPFPVITVAIDTLSVCSGDTINGILNSNIPGTSFSWTASQDGVSGAVSGNGANFTQSLTFMNIPGTVDYTITGTANSCSRDTHILITVHPLPGITSVTHTDVTACGGNDGSITISATNGNPFLYSVDGGQSFQSNNGSFTGLEAGYYPLAVKNIFNCTVNGSTIVISNGQAPPPYLPVTDTSYCLGDPVTNIMATPISGGAISWYVDPGLTTQVSSGTEFNPNPFLVPGVNNFYVTESTSGCSSSPAILTISIQELPDPAISITSNISCYGQNTGSATVTASGGQPPYSCLWQNGSPDTTINGLAAGGYYHVTITDASGCSATDSILLSQPPAVTTVFTISHVSCKGGSDGIVSVVVSGGTAPYTYSWSNLATGDTINNITSGSYSVTVSDFNNCNSTGSVSITEPALALELTLVCKNETCSGSGNGSVSAAANGGVPPYNYQWSNNLEDSVSTSLSAGIYHITVKDNNNCRDSSSATISEPEPILLTADSLKSFASCPENNDGSLILTVTGGSHPYTYSWSNSSEDKDATKLTKGSYTVTVTDSSGCFVYKTFEVKSMTSDCIEIPSAFTPNNDDNNDNWVIKNISLFQGVTVEIYNRWGGIIFKSADYKEPWDGKYLGNDVTAGTYVYIITIDNGAKKFDGTVTVIR